MQTVIVSLSKETNQLIYGIRHSLKTNKRSMTKDNIFLFYKDGENADTLIAPVIELGNIKDSFKNNCVDFKSETRIYLLIPDHIDNCFEDVVKECKKIFKTISSLNCIYVKECSENEIVSSGSVNSEYIKSLGFDKCFVLPINDIYDAKENLYLADLIYELFLDKDINIKEKKGFRVVCANEARLIYPVINITEILACKRLGEGIGDYWLDIDREINSRYNIKKSDSEKYRRLYYNIYLERVNGDTAVCDGFYSSFKEDNVNISIALNNDKTISKKYTDKIDDFMAMFEGYIVNEINIAFDDEKCDIKSVTKKRSESVRNKMIESFISQRVAEMIKVVIPSTKDSVNQRNDFSLYGLISNQDELEIRTYVDPVSVRAISYSLFCRMKEYLRKIKKEKYDLKEDLRGYLTNEFIKQAIVEFVKKLNRFIHLVESFMDVDNICKELVKITETGFNLKNGAKDRYFGNSEKYVKMLYKNMAKEPLVKNFLGNSTVGVLINLFCKKEEPNDESNMALKNDDLNTEIKSKIVNPFRRQVQKANKVLVEKHVTHAIMNVLKNENKKLSDEELSRRYDDILVSMIDIVTMNMNPDKTDLYSICVKTDMKNEIHELLKNKTKFHEKQFGAQGEMKFIAIEYL